MRHTSHKRIVAVSVLLVGALLTLGCESDGPEFIEGDTRIIEGTLQAGTLSDTHFFVLTRTGTVNILASTVAAAAPETGVPIENPVLGVSIGQPNAEDQTVCQLTFSQALLEGDSFSVYYRDGAYCLTVFRGVGIPEAAELTYVVTLAGAFS